jgi:dTDP-4-amino-4,6-dideoxygalactose transaminase
MIPFNRIYTTGKENEYISEAILLNKISGDGVFTQRCHRYFEQEYQIKKTLLTTSCTDALEMASILIDIKQGDEVIIPSFTFVSTANAFVLRGARIVFADSNALNPNIDVNLIEKLITPRTKAIVPVHYAGIACDMDRIMKIAEQYGIWVIEDAAHSIESYYKEKRLGTIGHLSAFSFHQTKNITCGEGGMIGINTSAFIDRAEIIRQKGTDSAKFLRGEVDKYTWVDIGSSYLPSDITAAFLFAQLEEIKKIQEQRISLWNRYYENLRPLHKDEKIKLPFIPDFAFNNAQIFYLICRNKKERNKLMAFLKDKGIATAFHYSSLHTGEYSSKISSRPSLTYSDYYSDCLLRLPLYFDLTIQGVDFITQVIRDFYHTNNPVNG